LDYRTQFQQQAVDAGIFESFPTTAYFGSQASFGASSTHTFESLHEKVDSLMSDMARLDGRFDGLSTAFQTSADSRTILQRNFCDRYKVFASLLPMIMTMSIVSTLADPDFEWVFGDSSSFNKYTHSAVSVITEAYAQLGLPLIERGIYNLILQWTRF
jgi:hypothetical protein